MSYRLLVFDWDGTIIDSQATIVECLREASRELGLPMPERSTASHVIGLGLHDALRIVAPELAPHRYPEFVEHYRRHFLEREASMQLFPGMRALIELLAREKRSPSPPAKAGEAWIARSPRSACRRTSPPRAAPTRRIRSRIRRCCLS